MADRPITGPQLRAAVPTLEPDDAFVARLGSLAAAGAPAQESAAAPRATWRIALAAAGVAAILVGAAWLAGLGPSGAPDPTPAPITPATGPARPEPTPTATPSQGPGPTGSRISEPTTTPPRAVPGGSEPTARPSGEPQGHSNGQHRGQPPGLGPDEHSDDHPDEHATEKADVAHGRAGDRPARGAGGRTPR